MAIKVPSATEIAAKFARVTPGRSDDYQQGVQTTAPGDYQTATTAAAGSYAQGIQQAISQKRFERGVQSAGNRWQRKALDVGVGRFATGVAGAAQDYEQGFAPYQQTIAGLSLPPRGPAGDPKNIERVRIVAAALRARKVGG
jgi:hypothetical protein